MITIDKIKEYIKCPQFGDLEYGKWGALRLEQREAYKHLIDIIEGLEQEMENLKKINEEHKKLNGELRKENDALITVIDLAKEHLTIKLVRYINEKDYVLDDNDLDEILKILERVNEE